MEERGFHCKEIQEGLWGLRAGYEVTFSLTPAYLCKLAREGRGVALSCAEALRTFLFTGHGNLCPSWDYGIERISGKTGNGRMMRL